MTTAIILGVTIYVVGMIICNVINNVILMKGMKDMIKEYVDVLKDMM